MAELKARELELEASGNLAHKHYAKNEPELAVDNSPILIIGNSVESHHEQTRSSLRVNEEIKSAGELKERTEQRKSHFERLDGLATFYGVRKSYDHEPPHSILQDRKKSKSKKVRSSFFEYQPQAHQTSDLYPDSD